MPCSLAVHWHSSEALVTSTNHMALEYKRLQPSQSPLWEPQIQQEWKCIYIVTWHPKAGIVKSKQTFIARQRLGKQIPAAMNMQATIK
jgi:hypothetical protein